LDGLESVVEEALSVLSRFGPVRFLSGGSAVIVGDTHGYPMVSRWAVGLWEGSYDYLVFLGDYVDRGPRGLENLRVVLEAFLGDPGRVVLLRGNHESPLMNYFYGFYEEVSSYMGVGFYSVVSRLFPYLSYAAVLDGWFLVHGGIPCRSCTGGPEEPVSLGEIASEAGSVWGDVGSGLGPDNSVAFQLLWNDPRGQVEWFSPSIRGEGAYYYGVRAWTSFLERNSLRGIIRAHEAVDAFHVWLPDGGEQNPAGKSVSAGKLEGAVITVFSSLYHGQRAGVLVLEGSELHFKTYS